MPPNEATPKPAVLLVDDETPLVDALRMGLQPEFDVDLAGSAAEADRMLGERPYNVVVCDHLMPGEEGLQFLIRARERHPATNRILVTGYMNPELISRSITIAGLAACLIKPVRMADLSTAIRQAMK